MKYRISVMVLDKQLRGRGVEIPMIDQRLLIVFTPVCI